MGSNRPTGSFEIEDGRYVETFTAHNFEVMEARQSLFRKSKWVEGLLGYSCPRCGELLELTNHGQKVDCPHCQLHVELWGNALDCSENE